MAKKEELQCTKRVAERCSVSGSFLEKLRCYGDGPPYYKIGGTIRYKTSDVEAWLEKQRREPTSAPNSGNAPDRREAGQ